MTALEYARSYVARGWSVIPLVPGTKRPAVELRPFLTGDRRMNDDEMLFWWDESDSLPDRRRGGEPAGVGIICGQPSGGLVAVDVDPRNGGDCEQAERDCPTGYRVRTGGGGLHLYVHSDDLVPKGKTDRPGVDRQGDGSYVVAPPSVHPDTAQPYVVLSAGELAAVPSWALRRPGPPVPGPDVPVALWVADTLRAPDQVAPGTQEETLTRLSWWAAGHLDRDIAEAILGRWSAALPLGHPSHPWALSDVRQKLDSAYAKREPSFAVQGDSTGPASSIPPYGGNAMLLCPASAGSPLVNLEFPEQRWIVEDFVAPGAFTEVIGKVKKGKSTLVYQLIRAIVQGSDFLGRPAQAGPVVLVTEQSGSSLRATIERSGLPFDAPVYVVQKSGLALLGPWPEAVGYVIDVALWLDARVIVVDTLSRLSRLYGDAENKAGAVAVLDPFDRARSLGVACVFVRHARKGVSGEVDDIADAARGSSAVTGDMDIVLRLRQAKGDDVRVLSWESRLTDDPEDVALRYVDGRYEVTEMPESGQQANESRRTDEMRSALRTVGRSTAALRAALGWSQHTVERYRRVVEDGERLPEPPAQGDGRVKL